jgi:murein DD-endopeptidase MepM/ murein hydrolase activator NlpD
MLTYINFLNPFKFVALFAAILLASMACFGVVYVALIGLTAMNLPFGREVALRWMLGDELPWPFAPNPYYPVVSTGPALVPWLMPLQGDLRITASFLDPAYEAEFGRPHYGVDLSCPVGTPVYATHGGRVYHSGDVGTGLGLYVGLGNDHFASEYGHLSVALVQHGDVVQPGALIGYSGNTGRSTAPHLHYAVMYDYDWVDPAQFWRECVINVCAGSIRPRVDRCTSQCHNSCTYPTQLRRVQTDGRDHRIRQSNPLPGSCS